MRLERYMSPFFLALLISLPLLPIFSEEAHSSLLGRGDYGKKVRMKIRQEKKLLPRKGIVPGPGETLKENILIILDASGSMWGQVSLGEPGSKQYQRCKIEIAKKVLEEYVDDLDEENVNVGLRVFGRYRERGCKDSQLIIPVGTLDKEAFKETMKKVNPGHMGKTPMAYSLRKALVDISTPSDMRRFLDSGEFSGGEKSIILITDGEGGCDSIKEVRGLEDDLRLLGVDIVKINVIALKVPQKGERDQTAELGVQSDMGVHLTNISEMTEGQYISIEAKPGMGIEEFERQLSRSVRIAVPTNTRERVISFLYRSIHWINGFILTHTLSTLVPSMVVFSIFFTFAMRWFFHK
ncbi:MAG: VWA domain-containing protein [Proteobacteria bacterium]|nr:VWA domain-containing protein [Pseudomonadota bacterium]